MEKWFLIMPLGKRANANYGYSGICVRTEHKNERRGISNICTKDFKNRISMPKN